MVLGVPGVNPVGLLGQAYIAENPVNGHIYMLCSVNPPGDDPLDLHFVRSADRGLTWSAPVRINDDDADTNAFQWFGTMSVAPNGRIDAVWNDTRNDALNPNPTSSELFYASSADGGVTWTPNIPVSPSYLHGVGYPQQQKMGDYYHMVSDRLGAHVAYAATHNDEQDVWYLRIGDYDCNGNGVADGTDITGGTSLDCNLNGIPDECDIAAGASRDVNTNGIPDECEIIATELDIKPGACPNPMNPRSRGVLPVALVGTADVPAADVDQATLALVRADGVGGSVAPFFGPPGPNPQIVDVTSANPGADCTCDGGGGDAVDDLLLKFLIPDLATTLELLEEAPGAEVALKLTGQREDGRLFEAIDCVILMPAVERPGAASRLDGDGAVAEGFRVQTPVLERSAQRFTIRYRLPARAQVSATVHDLMGRRVRSLLDAVERPSGAHEVRWDGTDERGARVGSGVYLIRLRMQADAAGVASAERTVRAVITH